VWLQVLTHAQVEYQHCYLFAVATLNSLAQTTTLLGILGTWWEVSTIQTLFYRVLLNTFVYNARS